MAKKKTTKKTAKKKWPNKIKIDAEISTTGLLFKLMENYSAKEFFKHLLVMYMHEGSPYFLSTMALLADKKDVENAEAALALAYLVENWDEAVQKGGEIVGKKLKKAENEKN